MHCGVATTLIEAVLKLCGVIVLALKGAKVIFPYTLVVMELTAA